MGTTKAIESSRASVAHRAAIRTPVAEQVGFLSDQLGQSLVAYLAGVSDTKTVRRWIQNEQTPREESKARVQTAFQVYQFLLQYDSMYTVRAWFVGINPQLQDTSPSTAIRESRLEDVMIAARAFASGG
ncbi:MAG TPA: XRE family transcriptional regulator [Actinobacteria bacterium]|nr:hypothetical protein BMS3Bbin02_02177 [bacterium BMS3Bbin02]HDL41469.1 XRE family transcriptional regulator [Actinomycetota bacterium]